MKDLRGPDAQLHRAFGPWCFHALLVAPALAFFAPHLFFGRALYVRDTGLYFYPHRSAVIDALLHGRLPQWTPAEYAGVALLADLNDYVFHPLSALTLLPMPWSYQLFVFAGSLAAAYGAAAAARELGLSRGAQVIAGLCFAWSGPYVSLVESGQFLVLAFVPWLCAGASRVARDGSPRALAWCALAALFVFTAGTPEVGACGFLFAAVLALQGGGLRGLMRFTAAGALGGVAAAIQLVPTALFLSQSSRAHGFDATHVLSGSLALLRLPSLLVPFFAGALDAPGTRYWALPADRMAWVEELYLCAVPVALALLGRRRFWWLLAAAVLLTVLALGGETPLTAAVWLHLPGLRTLRFPEKLYAVVPLAVALAAGAGWDRLGEAPVCARAWLVAAAGCTALAITAPIALLRVPLSPRALACLRDSGLATTPTELGLLALCCALVAAAALGKLTPARARLAFGALLALDLAMPAARMDWTLPAHELDEPVPLAAAIERDAGPAVRLYRVDVDAAGVSSAEADELADSSWARPRKLFWLRHQALEHPGAAQGPLLLMRGYSGLPPGGVKQLFTSGGAAGLSSLAVRYGVEFGSRQRPSLYARLGFEPMGTLAGGWVRLWRNPRAKPRVRLAAAAVPRQGGAPSCDAVWLERPEDVPAELRAPGCDGVQPAQGTAALVRDEPEALELAVETAAPAIVVLADTLAAGWKVQVDGVPARALAADGGLRGVAVAPGSHRVRWTYRAPGLVGGAWASALGLAAIGGLFAAGFRRKVA